MPKTVPMTSHEAIKRSLKSKFKLILSENRILVETINGYVRKAEKVYKEMDATADVTPKQFAKAMEKLERAYSACVRLIMVASDLFEKGDMDVTKVRDMAASSCESETSVYSSESSTTITDSNRGRKVPKDKPTQRRTKSSDVRATERTPSKTKSNLTKKRDRTIELADISKAETSNVASERLYVRPGGSNSDFDHLIELQRFLHGLEREKLQTDHPSPCVAPEKQLQSYKIQTEKATTVSQSEAEQIQVSPEESPSQSLSQRLKILKSAIEHFKDRSLGDDRVTQALNDIRELVLKSRDPKEIRRRELPPDVEVREDFISQTSLVSGTTSSETREDVEEKDCGKHKGEHAESFQDAHQNEQRNNSPIKKKQSPRSPVASDLGQKTPHGQQQQLTSSVQKIKDQQVQIIEQKEMDDTQTVMSPANSPQVSDDSKDDINQIIVNKIVDMVSAKLAPRLQMKNGEVPHRTLHLSENGGLEREVSFPKHAHSPALYGSQERHFPQNQHQGNVCGNYNHLMLVHRHRNKQQPEQPQHQKLQKLQRRHQRPKVVSFVEDYECVSPYNTWNSRPQNKDRTFVLDSSPSSPTSSPFLYSEYEELERPQSCHNQQGNRFTSPHKKRLRTMHIPQIGQRYVEQHPTSRRQLHENEESDAIDVELDNEDNESERANDTDSEIAKEHSQYQSQDIISQSTPSRQSVSWRNKSLPKSPSFIETEYRTMHLSQRGKMCQKQQALHKTDSFVHRLSPRSPIADNHKNNLKESLDMEWLSPVPQPTYSTSMEGINLHQTESDSVNRAQYRHGEKFPSEHRPGESPVQKCSSVDYQASPKPLVTQSQLHTEPIRQFPTKMPRVSTPQSLVYQHSTIPGGQCGCTKLGSSDAMFQNSESSCEASPIFSQDGRSQPDNNSTGTSHEDTGVNDQVPARPEVVCIDATQLHADASRTITLSNLPLDLEETELLNIFKKYGQVTKIYYIKDRNTGVFQGRAYGKFSKASEAYQAAMDLQKLIIDGHEVCVQLYVNTP